MFSLQKFRRCHCNMYKKIDQDPSRSWFLTSAFCLCLSSLLIVCLINWKAGCESFKLRSQFCVSAVACSFPAPVPRAAPQYRCAVRAWLSSPWPRATGRAAAVDKRTVSVVCRNASWEPGSSARCTLKGSTAASVFCCSSLFAYGRECTRPLGWSTCEIRFLMLDCLVWDAACLEGLGDARGDALCVTEREKLQPAFP